MTEPDQTDDAAAAARRAHFDDLKRIAFARPTSPEQSARADAAQAELAREDARLLAEASLAAATEARAVEARAVEARAAGAATAPSTAEFPAPPARRRPWLIPLAAIAAVAVVAALIGGGILIRDNPIGGAAGTSASSPSAPAAPLSPAPALPTADPDLEDTVIEALGEAPPDLEYTSEQVASALALTNEEGWNQVLSRFPDAVRPDASMIRMLENDEYTEVLTTCLTARGVPVDIAIGGDGLGVTIDTQEQAIGYYLCGVEYPSRPRGLSAAQIAYVYDYFVQFKAPCLEKIGYPQQPAPTKDAFVSAWPRQGWNPHYSFDEMVSEEEILAIETACPSYPKGIN